MDATLIIIAERPTWEGLLAGAPWSFLVFLLAAAAAYLLGCSNGAGIISK